jgi:hypothetical protein
MLPTPPAWKPLQRRASTHRQTRTSHHPFPFGWLRVTRVAECAEKTRWLKTDTESEAENQVHLDLELLPP